MPESELQVVRERLLDAAAACYARGGIEALAMADIARGAQVARSTIYRYFPSRQSLLMALIGREIDAVAATLDTALANIDEPADYIVEGLVLALRELPRRQLFIDLFVRDHFGLARSEVWTSGKMVGLGQQFMRSVIEPAQKRGALREGVRTEILVEWVYRILISFLTLPSRWARDEEQLRTVLHALLIPVLLND